MVIIGSIPKRDFQKSNSKNIKDTLVFISTSTLVRVFKNFINDPRNND